MLCDLNYVNICMMIYLHVLYKLYWNWHHAFHMHWGTLEQYELVHEVIYLETSFRGLTNDNNYRSVSITISEGSPYNISIVGVGLIDIHRRVVH